MTCPFNEKSSFPAEGKLLYADYLMLDKVLNAQKLLSVDANGQNPAFDEHLFIIIHQTYELWFKQIIYELDIVQNEFSKFSNEKLNFSQVIKRLNRIVMILKLLVDQVLILETMTPNDFNAFRQHLSTASGFQSMQFRLIENKLGITNSNRVKFNQNYDKVFKNDEHAIGEINKSLSSDSLLRLVEKWLEHTPHLDVVWKHYKQIVELKIFKSVPSDVIVEENDSDELIKDDQDDAGLKKIREQFETMFDSTIHDALVKRGERKLSLNALRAAIIIYLFSNDTHCDIYGQSHQILMLLVDIDSMFSRWRYNHVLLVQRMIGSMQLGTGGSSGYQYLRSTLSDRYKPFVDLSNLTTFLINKNDLLPLNQIIETEFESDKKQINEGRKKGRKSTRRWITSGKRACNGRGDNKDGGKQRCLHCSNSTSGGIDQNTTHCLKICNVCIESQVRETPHEIRNNFQDLTMNSSEDEKKELESSYESTSSTSSTLNN